MAEPLPSTLSLVDELGQHVGAEHVLSDEGSLALHSHDIFSQGQAPLAVVRPGTVDELAACVAAATSRGHAVVPRGGGMSYTGGYLAVEADSVQFDMRRMNRVLEINSEDMYVTVECGCTWRELHQALEGTGLRTPFWGTLSGIKATVGGGLSQNGIFWGSGLHGSAVDTVVSLAVVLADGTIINTGSNAQKNSTPFFAIMDRT